jgi:hypothetical protein
MTDQVQIVDVNAENVEKTGFFCYKSKPKTEGYRKKINWLKERFAEGLRLKMVSLNGSSAGFIEYIPGEYAWRAVSAPGYMLIHCLWVVGKNKEQGFGARLLAECEEDARRSGKHGVAMVTSSGTWLAGKELLLNHGYKQVDEAPPSFQLMVKRFGDAPLPAFPTNWQERLARCGAGMTIFTSDQCPYLVEVSRLSCESAEKRGLSARIIEVKTCREAQEVSPSPYGVFNVVYNGSLVAYHWMDKKELAYLDQLIQA